MRAYDRQKSNRGGGERRDPRVLTVAGVLLCALLAFLSCIEGDDGAAPTAPADNGQQGPAQASCQEDTLAVCQCLSTPGGEAFAVVSPNGGEVLNVGSAFTVRFCNENSDPEYIRTADLALSVDDGKTWTEISPMVSGDRYHARVWVVPGEVWGEGSMISTVSTQCRIRVSVYDEIGDPDTDFDVSDSCFTIQE